jgi:hypothetical protein
MVDSSCEGMKYIIQFLCPQPSNGECIMSRLVHRGLCRRCPLTFRFCRLSDKRLRWLIDFSVACWGWLAEGSFRYSSLPLIQGGRYGQHLGSGFRWLSDKCLGLLVQFFVAYWGRLEEGSFPWPAPPLIQDGWYGSHLRFGFRRLSDKCLV